jgi:hypothetical protein
MHDTISVRDGFRLSLSISGGARWGSKTSVGDAWRTGGESRGFCSGKETCSCRSVKLS